MPLIHKIAPKLRHKTLETLDANPGWLHGTWAIEPKDDDYNIAAVSSWAFAAFGRKPIYHMARDLISAAWIRDRRTLHFHKLTTEPPAWIEERVAEVPTEMRQAAIRLTAVDFLHRRQIGRLYDQLQEPEYFEVDGKGPIELYVRGEGHKVLLDLSACRPYGAEYKLSSGDVPDRDFTCRMGRICPWCRARQVVDLHDKLVAGPCSPANLAGKCLLRLQIEIDSHRLAHQVDFVTYAERHNYHKVKGLFRTLPRYQDRIGIESRLVRNFFKSKYFDPRRKSWGLEGGIITHQVVPLKAEKGAYPFDPHFGHELNLVATLTMDRAREVYREMRGMNFSIEHDDGVSDRWVLVELVRGELRWAVRHVLAGTAFDYRPKEDESRWHVDSDEEWPGPTWDNGAGRFHSAGVDGTLRMPPWHIATPEQWWEHQHATQGLKLYEAFGTWSRKTAATIATNAGRTSAALGRRKELLPAARDAFERLSGKAGERRLRNALEAAGHPVSLRDARELLSALRAEDGSA